jgi:hypothetical protein
VFAIRKRNSELKCPRTCRRRNNWKTCQYVSKNRDARNAVVLNMTCRCEDSEFYVCSFSSAVSPTLNKIHFGIFLYAYEKYNRNCIEWKRSVCTEHVLRSPWYTNCIEFYHIPDLSSIIVKRNAAHIFMIHKLSKVPTGAALLPLLSLTTFTHTLSYLSPTHTLLVTAL